MKVFLSALEASPEGQYIDSKLDKYYYNLMSYYYIRGSSFYKNILEKSESILIDSGAHSFQQGKTVEWEKYTKEYADWIFKHDEDKILGYFEMDIDPAGYPLEFVEYLRKILHNKSDKIIKVWHKGRGIEEFKNMCKNPENKHRIVAITGFKNEDIKDEDYIHFVNYAHKHNCKIHCLGMTRTSILDKVPFDYVDSSSWKQQVIYGRIGNLKMTQDYSKANRKQMMYYSYLKGMEMQVHYALKHKQSRRRISG